MSPSPAVWFLRWNSVSASRGGRESEAITYAFNYKNIPFHKVHFARSCIRLHYFHFSIIWFHLSQFGPSLVEVEKVPIWSVQPVAFGKKYTNMARCLFWFGSIPDDEKTFGDTAHHYIEMVGLFFRLKLPLSLFTESKQTKFRNKRLEYSTSAESSAHFW